MLLPHGPPLNCPFCLFLKPKDKSWDTIQDAKVHKPRPYSDRCSLLTHIKKFHEVSEPYFVECRLCKTWFRMSLHKFILSHWCKGHKDVFLEREMYCEIHLISPKPARSLRSRSQKTGVQTDGYNRA